MIPRGKYFNSTERALLQDLAVAFDAGRARPEEELTRKDYGINIPMVVSVFKERWVYRTEETLTLQPERAAGSHYFLFQKNLGVSNIPLVELLALLRMNATYRDTKRRAQINFYSDEQYTTFLRNLFESLYPSKTIETESALKDVIKNIVSKVATNYLEILTSTVVVEPYFTSAVVHIPKVLSLNIRKIVAESGYIHSVGYSLYARSASKAHQGQVIDAIKRFLAAAKSTKPIYITPYANEYFDPYDRTDSTASLRNGLDGVRIQLRKYFINGQPFQEFLNRLHRDFGERVYVARGLQDYRLERGSASFDRTWTIWFLTDYKCLVTPTELVARTPDPYLMVFAQYYRNGNQFVTFKERKPAWAAPVTLPHTLSIGMVNILRQQIPESAPAIVVDPFCGTGTTLIDAFLRIPNCTLVGLDCQVGMPQLVRDNLDFFSLDRRRMAAFCLKLSNIVKELESHLKNSGSARITPITQIHGGLNDLSDASPGTDISDQAVFDFVLHHCLLDILTKSSRGADWVADGAKTIIDEGSGQAFLANYNSKKYFDLRVLYYLLWRGLANGLFSLRSDLDKVYEVIHDELSKFLREAHNLGDGLAQDQQFSEGKFSGHFGRYSLATMARRDAIARMSKNLCELDGRELIRKLGNPAQRSRTYLSVVDDSVSVLSRLHKCIDVIVTDPPYGFNTGNDILELHELYSGFVRAAVQSLKHGGQLMVALPAFARNGRQIPYFQSRAPMIRQIISQTESIGRRAISVSRTVPVADRLGYPPFYWSSSAALSRSVLWFTIEDVIRR